MHESVGVPGATVCEGDADPGVLDQVVGGEVTRLVAANGVGEVLHHRFETVGVVRSAVLVSDVGACVVVVNLQLSAVSADGHVTAFKADMHEFTVDRCIEHTRAAEADSNSVAAHANGIVVNVTVVQFAHPHRRAAEQECHQVILVTDVIDEKSLVQTLLAGLVIGEVQFDRQDVSELRNKFWEPLLEDRVRMVETPRVTTGHNEVACECQLEDSAQARQFLFAGNHRLLTQYVLTRLHGPHERVQMKSIGACDDDCVYISTFK